MTDNSPFKLQSLAEYPAVMTKEMVARALGVAAHNIPPLSRAGLIKALGRPDRYCVKHYSSGCSGPQFGRSGLARKSDGGLSPSLAHQKRAKTGAASSPGMSICGLMDTNLKCKVWDRPSYFALNVAEGGAKRSRPKGKGPGRARSKTFSAPEMTNLTGNAVTFGAKPLPTTVAELNH